jgi:inosose dehydratase
MTALDGELLVAAIVADAAWSAPVELGDEGWLRVARNLQTLTDDVEASGLRLVVHPHAGTLLEDGRDIEALLAHTEPHWCLDTGHLAIGGVDPAEFAERHAERIAHVHLKDVDSELARRVRSGELTLVDATRLGLFRPLGEGDARIDAVVEVLDRHGYERWLVLEQDTTLTGEEPPVGRGPMLDVRTSIDYLDTLAPANGGGVPKR